MMMQKESQKENIWIVILVILAIYQTNVLWLRETSSQNFIELLWNTPTKQEQEADGNVLLATRYAVGEGDGIYSVYYPNDRGQSVFLEEANDVLKEILSDKNVMFENNVANWVEILDGVSVVLQYDFLVDGEAYLTHYSDLKEKSDPIYFDYIAIVPAQYLGGETSAYFVNSQTNESICYSTRKSQLAVNFRNTLKRNEEELTYIATAQKTSSLLWRNLFLPQWAELPYYYASLVQTPVFLEKEMVSQREVEQIAKGFFWNFSVDWSSSDELGNFLFSDHETVVKYFPKMQVLEYYNYASYGGNDLQDIGLLEGYQIACDFLKNDSSLSTNVYLANIRKKNEETIYYFDYAVDNLPIIFSEAVKNDMMSEYAIEITIKNGSVKNYRRYMINYALEKEGAEILEIQFIDALDDAIKTYQTLVESKIITNVSDISLGYYVDYSDKISLKWFVQLYEYIFVIDSKELK